MVAPVPAKKELLLRSLLCSELFLAQIEVERLIFLYSLFSESKIIANFNMNYPNTLHNKPKNSFITVRLRDNLSPLMASILRDAISKHLERTSWTRKLNRRGKKISFLNFTVAPTARKGVATCLASSICSAVERGNTALSPRYTSTDCQLSA